MLVLPSEDLRYLEPFDNSLVPLNFVATYVTAAWVLQPLFQAIKLFSKGVQLGLKSLTNIVTADQSNAHIPFANVWFLRSGVAYVRLFVYR